MYNIVKEEYPQLLVELRDYVTSKTVDCKKVDGTIISHNSNGIITVQLKEPLSIYEDAMVSVNNVAGIVQENHRDSVLKIELKGNISCLKGNSISINELNVNIERIGKTIEKIENDDLDDYDHHILNCILDDKVPSYQKKTYKLSDNLNQSQKEAVNLSLNADDFHLILGPPGTGKTHVITEIIKNILKGDGRILVTAHTHRAVDNIIEKIEGNDNRILRLGPDSKISPINRKYSLEERRKTHSDWKEVVHLEDLMKKTSKETDNITKDLGIIQESINQRLSKREEYCDARDDIVSTIAEYENKRDDYKFKIPPRNQGYDLKLRIKENLEKNCEKYYLLAKSILNLENIEESLLDAEEFHQLKSTINKMEREKFIKRLTSIFNKSKYDEFIRDLEDKKAFYNLTLENYDEYKNQKHELERYYRVTYPNSEGKADEDALYYEKELLKDLDDYLESVKTKIDFKISNEKTSLIYSAYETYLNSLNNEKELIETEIEYVNTQITLQESSKRKLEEQQKNILRTLEKYEDDRSKLMNFIDNDLLQKSQLIAATVLSSAHPILEYEIFDFMIMDEASQVAAYTSILPLLKCKKFILVGDNKQLQPITKDELSEKLNKSIFNHFIEKYPSNYSFLDTQYRMNKEISDLSSNLFYVGKLKTDPSAADKTIESLKTSENIDINFNNPLTFIDTANMKYHEEGLGDGCENCKEAEIVVEVVKKLLDNGIDPHEIGVITPYKKQKNLINEHLKTCEVEVDTVYSFQGKEKDVIIMSFCKSIIGLLKRFQKKFIADPNQLNVSITRARKKLIVIGNSKTIKQSPLIKELLETIGKSNTIKLSKLKV